MVREGPSEEVVVQLVYLADKKHLAKQKFGGNKWVYSQREHVCVWFLLQFSSLHHLSSFSTGLALLLAAIAT